MKVIPWLTRAANSRARHSELFSLEFGKISENPVLGVLNALSLRRAPARAWLLDGRQGDLARRRKARGDLFDICAPPRLHKIIIHNDTDDPESIRSVWNRFGRL